MNVYLAGPMRGRPEFNFPAFAEAREWLRASGYTVFCPAEKDLENGFDPTGMKGDLEELADVDFDLRKALGMDLDFIAEKADAVAVLPGWETSSGAKAEVATALALGLRIIDAYLAVDITDRVSVEGYVWDHEGDEL